LAAWDELMEGRVMDHVCKLLLVDDDKEFLEIVLRRFARCGVLAAGATNPEAALDAADRQEFHVAVLDRSLPGLDGIELMVRLHDRRPELQVILLSGHGDEQAIALARDCGAFDYLVKPCSLSDLETAVSAAYRSANQSPRQSPALSGVTDVRGRAAVAAPAPPPEF
jgi:DNA-binding response OmpR family regulator